MAGKPPRLGRVDLQRPTRLQRSFVITLLFVEEDNGDLADDFARLENSVGTKVKTTAGSAAKKGAVALAGAALGQIGSQPEAWIIEDMNR